MYQFLTYYKVCDVCLVTSVTSVGVQFSDPIQLNTPFRLCFTKDMSIWRSTTQGPYCHLKIKKLLEKVGVNIISARGIMTIIFDIS